MIRTTPDRAFAEAAKSELLRRARDSTDDSRARSARPSRGVWRQLAITAAVAALIGGVMAGTGLLHAVLTPTPPAASTPTEPHVTTGPAPTPASTLVAPPGYQLRTEDQLRRWGGTVSTTGGISRTVWIQQQILITRCMADHGFLYDPIYRYEHAMGALPVGHEQAYEDALHGADSSQPSSWRALGCTGLAEHETGHDPNS